MLRIHLPMQGMWVQSLVKTLRPHMPKGPTKPMTQQESPCSATRESPSATRKTQYSQKHLKRQVLLDQKAVHRSIRGNLISLPKSLQESAAAILAIRLISLDKETMGIVPGNHWAGGKVFYSRISERIHASWIHMVRKAVHRARRKCFSRII